MSDTPKLHDVVALLEDLPEHGLRRGDVGAVVEVFERTGRHPAGYIVEFLDSDGRVRAQADVTDAARLIKLHFDFKREAA
jgi:3,4-dihydroxy-2-butanone 4-phosphate synthase